MVLEPFKHREYYNELSTNLYTPQMTKIRESRIIKHWDKMRLLYPKNTEINKWAKYTMPEMIWINTITEMRDFGLPIPDIKRVYDSLLSPNIENWSSLVQSIIYEGVSNVSIVINRTDVWFLIDNIPIIINKDGNPVKYIKPNQTTSSLIICVDHIVESTLSDKTQNTIDRVELYNKFLKSRINA